jgi:hypothetical protein
MSDDDDKWLSARNGRLLRRLPSPQKRVAAFDKLHSKANDHACFCMPSTCWRSTPKISSRFYWNQRKARLRKVLSRRRAGIVLQRASSRRRGNDLSARVPAGLGGRVVSKRRDLPYRSGLKSWLKIKNPKSPAALRIADRKF